MAEPNRDLWNTVRITTATTTVVSARGVILGKLTVNDGGVAAGLVDYHNHPTAASNLIFSIKVEATGSVPRSFGIDSMEDSMFGDGLVIVTDQATDITVQYWEFQ